MNGSQSASLARPNHAAPAIEPGFVTRPWASTEPARLKKESASPIAQKSHPTPLSGRRTAISAPITAKDSRTSPNPAVAGTLRAMSGPYAVGPVGAFRAVTTIDSTTKSTESAHDPQARMEAVRRVTRSSP